MVVQRRRLGRSSGLWRRMLEARYIYLMLLPALAWFGIFVYKPIYGLLMAFEKFNIRKGILGSEWIGLANFERLFITAGAMRSIVTTLEISLTRLAVEFFFPILLAIFINEMRGAKLKRVYQTIFTFPHFLSWVVVGIVARTLFRQEGLINAMIGVFGVAPVNFMASKTFFRPLLYISSIWKGAGWSAIIYMAAIMGINTELYEAAEVDGANRFHKMFYITWPEIRSTAVILLILAFGGIMSKGYDQILNMTNAVVRDAAETIDTYIYRITFQEKPKYGFSTAIGLSKSIINFIFLLTANKLAKLLGEGGIM